MPEVRPERIGQPSPALPWDRGAAWDRFWTLGRTGQEVRRPPGNAHDAGIFMAIQLWRELMGFDRVQWDSLGGNMLDSFRARVRVGAVCWSEALLRRQAEMLQSVRDGLWKPWEDLVREASERGTYGPAVSPGRRDARLDVDPWVAAMAYANGWIGQRGELTWDSLVFDGIMLVECGVLEGLSPVWGDGGPALQLRDLPVDLRAGGVRMVPGIRMHEWMVRTGWTPEALAAELGVSRESVVRWRLGHRPHNGSLAALRLLSEGLINEASFVSRKPPETRHVELALRRLQEAKAGTKRGPGRPPGVRAAPAGLDVGSMLSSLRGAGPVAGLSRFHAVPDGMLPGMPEADGGEQEQGQED